MEDHQNYLSTVRMRLRGQSEIFNDCPVTNRTDKMSTQDTDEIMSKSVLFDTLKLFSFESDLFG